MAGKLGGVMNIAALGSVPDDQRLETPGVGFMLRESYRAFSRGLAEKLEHYGVTHSQWVFLWFLHQRGNLSPHEFAKLANIKKASVTGVLNTLHAQGLIDTKRNDNDGRQLIVSLTPHGRTTVKRLFKCAIQTNERATAGMSQSEIASLISLLQKITINLHDDKLSETSVVRLERKKKSQSRRP